MQGFLYYTVEPWIGTTKGVAYLKPVGLLLQDVFKGGWKIVFAIGQRKPSSVS